MKEIRDAELAVLHKNRELTALQEVKKVAVQVAAVSAGKASDSVISGQLGSEKADSPPIEWRLEIGFRAKRNVSDEQMYLTFISEPFKREAVENVRTSALSIGSKSPGLWAAQDVFAPMGSSP